jgi:hypothetical protein
MQKYASDHHGELQPARLDASYHKKALTSVKGGWSIPPSFFTEFSVFVTLILIVQ